MAGPLTGIQVLELAEGVAGPYCGRLLAGLGARVIKVEPPGGDRTRRDGPFPGNVVDPERSGLFLHLNTGKRSVLLDRHEHSWLERMHEMLAGTDVLLLSSRPSELIELGIDFDVLLERHPRVVVTSVTQFGLSGPYAELLGDELISYALSGYMSLTGDAERHPIKAYGSLVQYQAGAHAALGTMAALFARTFSGRGQVVDVAAKEAGTFLMGGVEQTAYFFGRVERRNGTRVLGLPPQQPYPSTIRPCADGHVHAHSNNRRRELLHALIPHPRLLDPDLLSTMSAHANEIDAILDEWLATRLRRDIVRQAQALRLPFTEVMRPGEVIEDSHHIERQSFVVVDHPGAGRVLQPGGPARFSRTPWRTGPAPTLGQHTEEVFAEARSLAGAAGGADSDVGAASGGLARPRSSDVADVSGAEMIRRPLTGVRVVDFTNAVAGPLCTTILADLGAEVIKVEAPSSRSRGAAGTAPLAPGGVDRPWDRSLIYNAVNHSKRAVALDVAKPAGRQLFLELVAQSDVVVENFAPRVLANLGVDYEALRTVRPDIILVSMPAFGSTGPYRDRVSYDPGIDAMSGLSHLTGYADGAPNKPGNFFCDQNAGVHAAFSTLAALWHRRLTGEGQYLELAMIEGEFQIVADAFIDYAMNGHERRRAGNDHHRFAPHDVFPCDGVDAWVAIGVESDAQWRALCSVIGRPDLAVDERFATAEARHANRPLLSEPISAWTAKRTDYEAQHVLQAAGVPAGAVLDAGQLLHDPQVEARHGFEYVETPNVGPTPYPRVAFTLSATPVPIAGPGPAFGAANVEIFGELLGHSAEELVLFEQAGVIAFEPPVR